MVAYPESVLASRPSGARWSRLPLAITFAALVTGADFVLKARALAAGHGALDVPTTLARPVGSALVGLLALAGVLRLPRACVPGALLVVAGAGSNLVSLALWPGVPNPFSIPIAGGVLHFNLADTCVWTGGVLFFTMSLWTLWRMPAEEFARLVGDTPERTAAASPVR